MAYGLGSLHCPCAASTQGVVSCTHGRWFQPDSSCRSIASFLCLWRAHAAFFQSALGGMALLTAAMCFAAAGPCMQSLHRVTLTCNSSAVWQQNCILHVQPLVLSQQWLADLVTPCMMHDAVLCSSALSFEGAGTCHRLVMASRRCNMIAMIGT